MAACSWYSGGPGCTTEGRYEPRSLGQITRQRRLAVDGHEPPMTPRPGIIFMLQFISKANIEEPGSAGHNMRREALGS